MCAWVYAWGCAWYERRSCACPQGWRAFTTGAFKCSMVPGNHLWPLDKESKRLWLEAVAAELPGLCLERESSTAI